MTLVWEFKTRRFVVRLDIETEYGYEYDGEDENGEIQAKLDSGEYVAFTSKVSIRLDGCEIAADHLGGSVYETPSEFWTAHRDSDPLNRNSSLMRAERGSNVAICHYFPSMVAEACASARRALGNVPHMREVANAT